MKVTVHVIKANNIKYKIITGRKGKLIQFRDENNDTLHYSNTDYNRIVVVPDLIELLSTRERK